MSNEYDSPLFSFKTVVKFECVKQIQIYLSNIHQTRINSYTFLERAGNKKSDRNFRNQKRELSTCLHTGEVSKTVCRFLCSSGQLNNGERPERKLCAIIRAR